MAKNPKIFSVNPDKVDDDAVSVAAEKIKKGGLVVFPTNTFYGLGASAFKPHALDRVFEAKGRPKRNPLLVLIATMHQLSLLVGDVPKAAQRLTQAFWPGGLTILFAAKDDLCSFLTGDTGKIGVRLTAHPIARSLINKSGDPISGTSANRSGHPSCATVRELEETFTRHVDLILDAGRLPGGHPSTVVDATSEPVEILREGVVSARQVYDVLA